MISREESFKLENSYGQSLVGRVAFASLFKRESPTLIMSHGLGGHMDRNKLLYRILPGKGINVVRFDFSNGCGKSDGEPGDVTLSHCVDDLRDVVSYFRGQSYVSDVHLFGHSLGGAASLLYAAEDSSVKSANLLAPAYDFRKIWGDSLLRKWKENGHLPMRSSIDGDVYFLDYGFYEDAVGHDLVGAVKSVRCPLLVAYGTEDNVLRNTDVYFRQLYRDANEPKMIRGIEGAGHIFEKRKHLVALSDMVYKNVMKGMGC